jgi:hypothetical protein
MMKLLVLTSIFLSSVAFAKTEKIGEIVRGKNIDDQVKALLPKETKDWQKLGYILLKKGTVFSDKKMALEIKATPGEPSGDAERFDLSFKHGNSGTFKSIGSSAFLTASTDKKFFFFEPARYLEGVSGNVVDLKVDPYFNPLFYSPSKKQIVAAQSDCIADCLDVKDRVLLIDLIE